VKGIDKAQVLAAIRASVAVGIEPVNRGRIVGCRNADRFLAAQNARVDAVLGGVVDQHADEIEGRMPDHFAQGAGADAAITTNFGGGANAALILTGAGSYTLNNSNNSTKFLAANVTGPFTYANAGDLTIARYATVSDVGKALKPSGEEVDAKPRARSAVMRVAEKL